jgi:uncharacterized membrane protein
MTGATRAFDPRTGIRQARPPERIRTPMTAKTAAPASEPPRHSTMAQLRNHLLTGLIVIGPTALSLWVFFRLLNWMDSLLPRFVNTVLDLVSRTLRLEPALTYERIPGLGLLASLLLLLLVGWTASWLGARSLFAVWEGFLQRIPGIGIIYGSVKSVGEALLNKRGESAFRHVVLVQWPHPGMWRIGFVTGRTPADVRARLGEDTEVVFVPHSPNPASGFVHYAPRRDLVFLDWSIEDGLKVVVSGGVVQPPGEGAAVPPA